MPTRVAIVATLVLGATPSANAQWVRPAAPDSREAASGEPAAAPSVEEPEEPDWLATSDHLISGALSVSDAPQGSFERALAAHSYGDSPLVFSGEVSALARVLPWLWAGGRVDGRSRQWARSSRPSAAAFQIGILGLLEIRILVNRVVDVGLGVGLGLGGVGLRIGEVTARHLALRAHLGGTLAVSVAAPVRAFLRLGWDYCRATDINDQGHDLGFGGAAVATGLEVRL